MSAQLVTADPHPALAGAVLRLEGFAECGGPPTRFRALPAVVVPIIVDFGAGWSVHDAGRARTAQRLDSFVAGLFDRPVTVGHAGVARCVQIDLTPQGARALLGVPLHELTHRTVALDDVLGAAGRQLSRRVGEAPDWPTRFALAEQALRARLTDTPGTDRAVAWACGRLAGTPSAAVGDLAAELGWSHRRLIARFRDCVGVTPASFRRIARFERLTAVIRRDPQLTLADLAARCCFADQAHMTREVRDLAHTTPAALRAEVNSVQDALAAPP